MSKRGRRAFGVLVEHAMVGVLVTLTLADAAAQTAGEFFRAFSHINSERKPPAPPSAVWAAPPSTPPPTVSQRFESDSIFRCAAMGVEDADGCCATEGIEQYCCQPCRLVWLNVTSAGLTERGRHYRVEQCLPLAAAIVRAPDSHRRRRTRSPPLGAP